MDPREVKEIMSEGAIRPETARDREERRILEADLAVSPVKGKPLRRRLRNFRPDGDAAVRALGGPTIWMRRLRAIENELEHGMRSLSADAIAGATKFAGGSGRGGAGVAG